MKIEQLDINEYDYLLEEERIAKYPLSKRGNSNLLICKKDGPLYHCPFSKIENEVPENSLIIYNNTKVIHARIEFRKETGARVEVFCISPIKPIDYQLVFSTKGTCTWKCMVGNLKKWKTGILRRKVTVAGEEIILSASRLDNDENGNPIIQFNWNENYIFSEVLEQVGKIPIPPYLNRETEEIDSTRYQTVYSKHDGSVAAPTAGLHFTPKIIEQLKLKKISFEEVTLHVGAGTFQPVKVENALNHTMHAEQFIVSRNLLESLIMAEGPILATGTTTLRTLESIYWLGVKAIQNEDKKHLGQWFWKTNSNKYSLNESIQALLAHLEEENKDFITATTEIMIVPDYKFKVVEGIITNFHQPKSTLLLLIAALIGDRWKEVYSYALKNNFRFLSYGDSSLLWRV